MTAREEARKRVFNTLLMNAVLRWETFVTLLITLVLFFGVGDFSLLGITLPGLVWLLLGGAAEGALVLSALTDPEEAREAMAREFDRKYDLTGIKNQVSRERLRTALEYRRNMLQLVNRHEGAMKRNLLNTVDAVNDWIAHMYNLANHIDSFESNELVERDLKKVPDKIRNVETRIKLEEDERVRADLQRQLRQLQQQKLNLEQTKNSVKRAEIQLESALSSLGTIYAQMSLLGTKDVDSGRAARLTAEIRDEVDSLQDTIEAMDEVQHQSLSMMS